MVYQKMLLGEETYFVKVVKASFPAHCHNEIEVVYCISGESSVIIGDEKYILHEGEVLLIDSLSMHQFIIEEGNCILDVEFGAQFLGSYFNEFARKDFVNPLLSLKNERVYTRKMIEVLKKIYKEHLNEDKASLWAVKGYLNELFAIMVRYISKDMVKNELKQKKIDKYLRFQQVFDYVKQNYNRQISIAEAAEVVGYYPNAFCRLFKEIANMSFHQYLNFYRIDIARNLLEYKGYSISEIGEQVGIPVPKTFGRVFKNCTGMSPREYRQIFASNIEG